MSESVRQGRTGLQDALFLTGIAVLSLVSYVGRLGFYLDDYAFMRVLARSHSHSFSGLYAALEAGAPKARMRPVQIATLAGLYKLFGPHAHPYHIFNASVLVLGVLLIYFVLRELGQSRLVSVAAALLYATLPHFSTDRFWVAAFQANVSMTLYFASQYAALRALRATGKRWVVWGLTSVLAALASVLAYEVALPLFLLTPVVVVYRMRQLARSAPAAARPRRRTQLLLGLSLVSLAAAVAAKVVVAIRVGHESSYRLGFGGGLLHHLAYLVSGSLKVSFGSYGLGLPYVVGWVVAHQLSWTVAALTLVGGVASFAYLRHLAARRGNELPSASQAKRLIGAGIVVFVLGYAVFVTNSEVFFTSAGVDNRVNIAATAGVALMLVGLFAWIVNLLPTKFHALAFALGVGLVCTAGFLIVNSLASFWVEAAQKQETVLADVRAHLPPHPGRATLLLDGVCPEVGPAIVFTTQYDLTGALFLKLRDPDLNAAVISPYVQVRPDALSISYFFNGSRTSLRRYPYGRRSVVYNYERKSLYRLEDAGAARRYFGRLRARVDCPPIRSFIWGLSAKWRRVMA